ncbi:MAG: hypothetical protein ACOX52_22755 [Verrucomicrobiota bacterium]
MNRFSEIEIENAPYLYGTWPSEHRSNLAVELCRHRNHTVTQSGFSCPNPSPRPFDSETDSAPDLTSPLTVPPSKEIAPCFEYFFPLGSSVSRP